MKEFKEKVQKLIDKYSPELSKRGLKILLQKKYFESEVQERSGASGSAGHQIFNHIDRARDRKKEKESGYNYERNKYHVIVITPIPCGKSNLHRQSCRDYAFVLRKVERAHIGLEPRQIEFEEEKILSKIEKRILKIMKKAEKMLPQDVCHDNIFDAMRYSSSPKYEYKDFVLGKNIIFWITVFYSFIGVLALGTVLILWLIATLI